MELWRVSQPVLKGELLACLASLFVRAVVLLRGYVLQNFAVAVVATLVYFYSNAGCGLAWLRHTVWCAWHACSSLVEMSARLWRERDGDSACFTVKQ